MIKMLCYIDEVMHYKYGLAAVSMSSGIPISCSYRILFLRGIFTIYSK
jgi:hypothetical protein